MFCVALRKRRCISTCSLLSVLYLYLYLYLYVYLCSALLVSLPLPIPLLQLYSYLCLAQLYWAQYSSVELISSQLTSVQLDSVAALLCCCAAVLLYYYYTTALPANRNIKIQHRKNSKMVFSAKTASRKINLQRKIYYKIHTYYLKRKHRGDCGSEAKEFYESDDIYAQLARLFAY